MKKHFFYSGAFLFVLNGWTSVSLIAGSISDRFTVHPLDRSPTALLPAAAIDNRDASKSERDAQTDRLVHWLNAQANARSKRELRLQSAAAPTAVQKQALQDLDRRAAGDVEVKFRPNGTAYLIKGDILEPRFSGIAKADENVV